MAFWVFYLSFSTLYGTWGVSDVFVKVPRQELLVPGKKLGPVSYATSVSLAKIFFQVFMIKEKEFFPFLSWLVPISQMI